MDTRYSEGLKREVVAMRERGLKDLEISRSLGVTQEFIQSAWMSRQPDMGRSWEPEYEHVNETGGY